MHFLGSFDFGLKWGGGLRIPYFFLTKIVCSTGILIILQNHDYETKNASTREHGIYTIDKTREALPGEGT